jgi:predicted metalloprotease with PDZ domain
MLADLLPDFAATPLTIEFALPPLWILTSSAEPSSRGSFQLSGKSNAVFFIGTDLSKKNKRVGGTNITLVTAGEWLFSKDAALERAARIIKEYSARTGFDLKRPITVMLAELPGETDNKGWAAETRGQNLILLANRSRAAKFSLGQLSVVLCHELFHLWIPNALSFSGDFDWFFEGFTLYQALSTAVRLGYVDFQEYLNTLSRVYGSYLASAELGKLSLIEASHRRWTSGASLVYDQGMLLAFLVDLKLRMDSRNASGLDSVYQQLLRQYPGTKEVDGNEAVTELIARLTGGEFFKRAMETPITIDLKQLARPYGMSVSDDGRLQIIEPLTEEQRALLHALGYRKSRK